VRHVEVLACSRTGISAAHRGWSQCSVCKKQNNETIAEQSESDTDIRTEGILFFSRRLSFARIGAAVAALSALHEVSSSRVAKS